MSLFTEKLHPLDIVEYYHYHYDDLLNCVDEQHYPHYQALQDACENLNCAIWCDELTAFNAYLLNTMTREYIASILSVEELDARLLDLITDDELKAELIKMSKNII